MALIENETHTRTGRCPIHGSVSAEKDLPKLKFPLLVTGPARLLAGLRPYHCPQCGARAA